MAEQEVDMVSMPAFRGVKRRKIYRRREDSPDEATPSTAATVPSADAAGAQLETSQAPTTTNDASPPTESTNPTTSDPTLPSLPLTRRRPTKPRRAGIEFSTARTAAPADDTALIPAGTAQERAESALDVASRRFAPQTGVAAESHSQHMTAYIDSHLARLRSGPSPTTTTTTPLSIPTTTIPTPSASLAAAQRQPATVGRLQEIDLGPSAAARNVLATEAATRTLRGEPAPAPASPPAEVIPAKPRLGRDGKPLRKRVPKRRNSEDVKRDRIVEDLLRENRLDIYPDPPNHHPTDPSSSATPGTDLAADDRVAEAFRREFLDAAQARRDARPPAPVGVGQGGKAGKAAGAAAAEVLRGPKLGGSRSARAAMRAQMLAEAAAGKGRGR